MAQILLPEQPHKCEQLQSSLSASDSTRSSRYQQHRPQRIGHIDLLIILVLLCVITLLVIAASRWVAPLTPVVSIALSPGMPPVYAGYLLLCMLLSLLFALVYRHLAATNRRAERMAAFVVLVNRVLWKRLYAPAERRYILG